MEPPSALFVDDEPYVLNALRRIFLDDDLKIEFAASGEEALDLLKVNRFDLILTDHNMPGLSGVEFLQRCKDIQPECIRMLITGRGDMDMVLQAINLGSVYKFFTKPWEDEDVRLSVLRAIEFKRTQELMRHQEEKLARFESYRQTMVTVSHYINNFNCGLIMSIESLKSSPDLPPEYQRLVDAALKSALKISEVLRILNQLQDIKIAEYPYSNGMIDIEKEVEEVVKKLDN